MINDIQPVIDVKCTSTNPPKIKIDCDFKNLGTHKVSIDKPGLVILGGQLKSKIDSKAYTVKGLVGNTIPSNGTGGNTFFVLLKQNSLRGDFVIRLDWQAYLHPFVKRAIVPLVEEVIDAEKINNLTRAKYTFELYH